MRTEQRRIVEVRVEEASDAITHVFDVNRSHCDWPLSILVCEAVEEVAARPTNEIEPLGHSVDVDALDDLFGDRWDGQPRTDGKVTFPMDEYTVTVVANERIVVTEHT